MLGSSLDKGRSPILMRLMSGFACAGEMGVPDSLLSNAAAVTLSMSRLRGVAETERPIADKSWLKYPKRRLPSFAPEMSPPSGVGRIVLTRRIRRRATAGLRPFGRAGFVTVRGAPPDELSCREAFARGRSRQMES